MPTPMRTLKLVNKIKKSGVVKQGSMKKENKYLKMLGTKATVMHPTTKVAKKVDKADVRKYVQKGWIHMTTRKNQLRKESTEEGYVSHAQRKAVWANKADGGKGHPDNKRKSKKENTTAALRKKLAKSAQSSEKGKKAVSLKPAPFKIPAKEATIPPGKTAMTKRPDLTRNDADKLQKIKKMMDKERQARAVKRLRDWMEK